MHFGGIGMLPPNQRMARRPHWRLSSGSAPFAVSHRFGTGSTKSMAFEDFNFFSELELVFALGLDELEPPTILRGVLSPTRQVNGARWPTPLSPASALEAWW